MVSNENNREICFIDELKQKMSESPHVYSDEELIEIGIDPNLFVFVSRPDFTDNAYALWEYIIRNTKYKTAWLVKTREHSIKLDKNGINNAVWNTPEGQKLGRSAKYFVFTTHDFSFFPKKRGQIFINVWHGAGIKASDYLDIYVQEHRLKRTIEICSDTDLFFVHSFIDKINMAAEFYCDTRRFISTGQPRLDRVKNSDGKNNIKKLFNNNLNRYDNLILFAPTFRLNSNTKTGVFFTSNMFNFEDYEKIKLDDLLDRNNAGLVIKLHPIDNGKFKRDDLKIGRNCFLLDDDDLFYAELQMNDILNAFDVMLSDYSSIITDFLFLDKPIIFIVHDIDEYTNTKGFVFNNVTFYMPGDKVYCFNEMLTAIEDALINPERHSEWRQSVVKQRFSFIDNKACERVLKAIENYSPIVDFNEKYILEKTFLPIAQKYEEKILEQEEKIWDYECRIDAVKKTLKDVHIQDKNIKKMFALISTPTTPKAEQHEKILRNELMVICDNILESYTGEYVFFSVQLNRDWDGKTRTTVQQIASQIANMGYLFIFGVIKSKVIDGKIIAMKIPIAQQINEKLIALDYCAFTDIVLESIKKHEKKAVLIIQSNFFDTNVTLMEFAVPLMHKTIYLFRYNVRNYLGMEKYSQNDISKWNALQYACQNENVNFIVYNNELLNIAKKDINIKKPIFLQTTGVDYAMFSRNKDISNVPEKLIFLKSTGVPVIGYCGTINKDLYFSIIHYICGNRPNYNFVFIGSYKLTGTVGHLFNDYPNIYLLDEVDYNSVPDVIDMFDVAIIPYFKTGKYRIPAKLFEYFACGKPVVTTDMEIGNMYKPVFAGESHGDFINALDEALALKDDISIQNAAREIAQKNDWKEKANDLLKIIEIC